MATSPCQNQLRSVLKNGKRELQEAAAEAEREDEVEKGMYEESRHIMSKFYPNFVELTKVH